MTCSDWEFIGVAGEPAGILDTDEKVREFVERLRTSVYPDLIEFARAQRRLYSKWHNVILD